MKFTVIVPSWGSADAGLVEGSAPDVGLVQAWRKEIGDRVAAGETLAVVQTTNRGEVAVVSPAFGILAKKFVLTGEAVEAGEPIATLAGVPPSVLPSGSSETPVPDPFADAPRYVPRGPEDVLRLSSGEQAYQRTLARARQVAPHVVTVAEADVTETLRLAGKSDVLGGNAGATMSATTLLPFLVSASAAALFRFPAVNAQLIAPDEARRKRYVRIAFPVYTDSNYRDSDTLLAAPVIAEADRKSVSLLAREIARLNHATHEGTLTSDERSGATFTVSPCDASGALYQTPTIHLPQAAHLGFGPPRRVPVIADDGTVSARSFIYLCLSHDARLISDREAARFLSEVKAHLEETRFLFA